MHLKKAKENSKLYFFIERKYNLSIITIIYVFKYNIMDYQKYTATKQSFDPKQHEFNVQRRIMERGSAMFNIDTRGQKYTDPNFVNNVHNKLNQDIDIGEITGTKFDVDMLEQRMPMISNSKSSKDITYKQVELNNPFIQDTQKQKTHISYFHPKLDFLEVKDDFNLLDAVDKYTHSSSDIFSLKFFNEATNKQRKSCIIATFTLYYSFIMIYLLSNKKTSEELKHYFDFPPKQDIPTQLSQINLRNANVNFINIILFNTKFPLNKQKIKELSDKVIIDDYYNDYTKINNIINNFTGIKNVLLSTTLSTIMCGVIDSTSIIFKWKHPFYKNNTISGKFGNTHIRYLVQHNVTHNYYEDNINQIIEIDHQNNLLTFGILLPKNKYDDPVLHSYDNLHNYITNMKMTMIDDCHIPMFKHESKYNLGNVIKGVTLTNMDLTEITLGGGNITHIIHTSQLVIEDSYISGDNNKFVRKGKVFVASHPFLYYVRHKVLNKILVVGYYY